MDPTQRDRHLWRLVDGNISQHYSSCMADRWRRHLPRGTTDARTPFVIFAVLFLVSWPRLMGIRGYRGWATWPFWGKAVIILVPALLLLAALFAPASVGMAENLRRIQERAATRDLDRLADLALRGAKGDLTVVDEGRQLAQSLCKIAGDWGHPLPDVLPYAYEFKEALRQSGPLRGDCQEVLRCVVRSARYCDGGLARLLLATFDSWEEADVPVLVDYLARDAKQALKAARQILPRVATAQRPEILKRLLQAAPAAPESDWVEAFAPYREALMELVAAASPQDKELFECYLKAVEDHRI